MPPSPASPSQTAGLVALMDDPTRNHALSPCTTTCACAMDIREPPVPCGAPATYWHTFDWFWHGEWRPQSRPMCSRHAGTIARAFRMPGAEQFE